MESSHKTQLINRGRYSGQGRKGKIGVVRLIKHNNATYLKVLIREFGVQ